MIRAKNAINPTRKSSFGEGALMVDPVEELRTSLVKIDSVSAAWSSQTRDLLLQTKVTLSDVLSHVAGLPVEHRQDLFDGSHETTTHYKWLLHRSQAPRFTIWLHVYKEAEDRTTGYAEVPHNHRYDICSRILTGGYIAAEWGSVHDEESVERLSTRSYAPSDVMNLRAHQVHSLTSISPATATIVIEGALRAHRSRAWYPDEPHPRTFPDFNERWTDLLKSASIEP